MTPVLILGCLLASLLLVVFACREEQTHGWRRCEVYPLWFDIHGNTSATLPFLAHFAIHADGLCPKCSEELERLSISAKEL